MTRSLPLLLVLLLPCPARAHALAAECVLRGERVEVEAFYDDGTPARKARVRVFDESQKLLQEGRTDEHGAWSFLRPAGGKYEVQVDAGAGHRKTVTLLVPSGPAASLPEPERAPPPATAPQREQSTPWLRLLLGVLIIAAGGVALLAVRRGLRRAP